MKYLLNLFFVYLNFFLKGSTKEIQQKQGLNLIVIGGENSIVRKSSQSFWRHKE